MRAFAETDISIMIVVFSSSQFRTNALSILSIYLHRKGNTFANNFQIFPQLFSKKLAIISDTAKCCTLQKFPMSAASWPYVLNDVAHFGEFALGGYY